MLLIPRIYDDSLQVFLIAVLLRITISKKLPIYGELGRFVSGVLPTHQVLALFSCGLS